MRWVAHKNFRMSQKHAGQAIKVFERAENALGNE